MINDENLKILEVMTQNPNINNKDLNNFISKTRAPRIKSKHYRKVKKQIINKLDLLEDKTLTGGQLTEAELIAERENITILEELNKNPNMDKNSVDKLVKKIKKLSEPSKKVLQIKEDKKLPNISWTDVFIYSIVPMGQLLARVKYLGGSLDKWYLLFLFFPPFSFIPMILMKYGIIKKDKKKSLYDNSILFPFVMKLIFPIILPLFINNNESPVLFQSILTGTFILSLFITNMYRRVVLCGSMTTDSIGKALIDSIFMEATSRSLPYIFEYIPLIGTVIRIVKRLPNVDAAYMNVASSASVVMGYLMVNLFNQTNFK